MSEDHGDDLNFNELVGNLLSSHNATEDLGQAMEEVQYPQDEPEHTEGTEAHSEAELPDFGAEEEDLAAVVANAIQNMNDQQSPDNELSVNFQEEAHEPQQIHPEVGEEGEQVEEQVPAGGDEEHQQNQEWAHMLQQGLMQGNEEAPLHPEEQLDQDDENLRRAILESLQELNVKDKTTPQELPKDKKTKSKKQSKKSSSKKKKSEEKTSGKKKKHTKKDDDDNLLNFEDVIRGFMHPETDAADADSSSVPDVGDKETQALVEATLKAFERELLGPAATAPKTTNSNSTRKKLPSSSKKSTSKKSGEKSKSRTYKPLDFSIDQQKASSDNSTLKSRKKKKNHAEEQDQSEEDDFSKQLVEMVNQVVNTTSATDAETEEPNDLRSSAEEASQNVTEGFAPLEVHTDPAGLEGNADETFDLNQIMQRAMNLAFQEQQHDTFDTSIMEEFNRGLADLTVTGLETPTTAKSKKKSGDKSSRRKSIPQEEEIEQKTSSEVKKPSKQPKDVYSLEKSIKKKYSQVALAAASAAKKRLSEKNKVNRLKVKEERQKVRESKKSKKKEERDKLEKERKELEIIVARGPPYPPDLRLTKSGKPKKPYRRWTPEEMEKRASMPPEDLHKPEKVKKVKKKKSKKLRRVPLYNLKNIPLFNFIKGNISNELKAKQKLNGIEDTLDRIHLQPRHLDINKLAPPNSMTPEEMAKEKDQNDANRNPVFNVSQRKTVVHREKIPFHPPWILPQYPPLALPVARRRRKEKTKVSREIIKNKTYSEDKRVSEAFNIRNKIIPAVLLPIINTLKAAARAKAASGATSEESNKHLMNIIKYTKHTIAQTLDSSRKSAIKDHSGTDIEGNLEQEEKKVRKVPIFSLANIRQIDTSSDRRHAGQIDDKAVTGPSLIKLEDAGTSSVPPRSDEAPGPLPHAIGRDKSVDTQTFQNNEESDENGTTSEIKSSAVYDPEVTAQKAETAHEETENLKNDFGNAEIDAARDEVSDGREHVLTDNQDSAPTSLPSVSEQRPSVIRSNDTHVSEVAVKKTELPVLVKNEGNETLTRQEDSREPASADEPASSVNSLEHMIKQHLAQSHDDNVDLPDNLSGVLYATLANIIPGFTENTKMETEKVPSRPERKPYKKRPPPVLNLDGLVPPSGPQVPPKIEIKQSLDRSVPSEMPNIVRKPRQKTEPPVLLHTFHVPNFKDMQGRRTMLLKRAKEHLNAEEMAILKKEINKERKRKWREANVEKNWEHDLRARVKRRASSKFGEADSAEKTRWFENEVSKGLAERGIKQEDSTKPERSVNGVGNGRKITGSTNLSDNEVLNMIATALGKLDVARALERELNDIHRPREVLGNKPRKIEAPTPAEHPVGAVENSVLEATEFTAVEQSKHSDDMDEVDEDGQIKRPYPDDIPVMVPILKRPKFLNAEGSS